MKEKTSLRYILQEIQAIDAMATTVDENYQHPIFEWVGDNRMILLTAHRRENLGEPMYHIFRAIRDL